MTNSRALLFVCFPNRQMVTVATWQEKGNSHNGEKRGFKDTMGITLTHAEAWSIMAETSTGNKINWTEVYYHPALFGRMTIGRWMSWHTHNGTNCMLPAKSSPLKLGGRFFRTDNSPRRRMDEAAKYNRLSSPISTRGRNAQKAIKNLMLPRGVYILKERRQPVA